MNSMTLVFGPSLTFCEGGGGGELVRSSRNAFRLSEETLQQRRCETRVDRVPMFTARRFPLRIHRSTVSRETHRCQATSPIVSHRDCRSISLVTDIVWHPFSRMSSPADLTMALAPDGVAERK